MPARLDASEHHKSDMAHHLPSLSTLHRTGCRSSSPCSMHTFSRSRRRTSPILHHATAAAAFSRVSHASSARLLGSPVDVGDGGPPSAVGTSIGPLYSPRALALGSISSSQGTTWHQQQQWKGSAGWTGSGKSGSAFGSSRSWSWEPTQRLRIVPRRVPIPT